GEQVDVGALTISLPDVKGVQVHVQFPSAEGGARQREIQLDHGGSVVEIMTFLNGTLPDVMSLQVVPGHYDALVRTASSDFSKLWYSHVSFDAGKANVDVNAEPMMPGAKIRTDFLFEDSADRPPNPSAVKCRLRSEIMITNNCTASVVPSFYQ